MPGPLVCAPNHEPSLGDELDLAIKLRQVGAVSSDIVTAISESRVNYWAAFATDFGCIFLFAWLGQRTHPRWPLSLFAFIVGWLVFTLIEYSIHRWLLHKPTSILYDLHEAHHNSPESTSAFLAPTSLVVLGLVWYLLAYLCHIPGMSYFISGISAGYFSFGALHHFEHTTRINQIPFRWLKHRWAAHSVHHHIDQTNFGVLTSFWDHIFSTHYKSARQRPSRTA